MTVFTSSVGREDFSPVLTWGTPVWFFRMIFSFSTRSWNVFDVNSPFLLNDFFYMCFGINLASYREPAALSLAVGIVP